VAKKLRGGWLRNKGDTGKYHYYALKVNDSSACKLMAFPPSPQERASADTPSKELCKACRIMLYKDTLDS